MIKTTENICTKINFANIFLCQVISPSCLSDSISFYKRKSNETVNYVIRSVSVRLHLMYIFSGLFFSPTQWKLHVTYAKPKESYTKNCWIIGACRSNTHVCSPPSCFWWMDLISFYFQPCSPNYYFGRNGVGGVLTASWYGDWRFSLKWIETR
jgi:hypothetical protein